MSTRKNNKAKRKSVNCVAESETSAEPKVSKYFENNSIPPSEPCTEIMNYFAKSGTARLGFAFYDRPCLELAKKLLGQKLVRKLEDGTLVAGIVVETEGYLGTDDPSAHSYSGQTARNKAMFMPPGTAYVYNIYGSYCCMNISSQGEGHAVLLRALQPIEGIERMHQYRKKAKKVPNSKPAKDKDLCSGPSKFCQAFAIDKASINEENMLKSEKIWLEEGDTISDEDIVVSTRIGIGSTGAESVSKPYRFYLRGNLHVSKRDKKAEGAK